MTDKHLISHDSVVDSSEQWRPESRINGFDNKNFLELHLVPSTPEGVSNSYTLSFLTCKLNGVHLAGFLALLECVHNTLGRDPKQHNSGFLTVYRR